MLHLVSMLKQLQVLRRLRALQALINQIWDQQVVIILEQEFINHIKAKSMLCILVMDILLQTV